MTDIMAVLACENTIANYMTYALKVIRSVSERKLDYTQFERA